MRFRMERSQCNTCCCAVSTRLPGTGYPTRKRTRLCGTMESGYRISSTAGHFRGGAKLHPAPSAKTVRMKNGSIDFTDGPFAETKEQLGGYHLIDCTDLNEAMSIAARIPTLPAGGTVEVRCIEALEC